MRAISLILLLLIFSALGYIYRDTITGWFTGSTPTQTVVLRQTASPSPTISPVPAAPTPSSITVMKSTPAPTVAPANLPTTGPEDALIPVLGLAGAIACIWRGLFSSPVKKRPLDIL